MRKPTGAGEKPSRTIDLAPDQVEVVDRGVLEPAPILPTKGRPRVASIDDLPPPVEEFAEDGRPLKRTRHGLFVQRPDGAWESYISDEALRQKLFGPRPKPGSIVAPSLLNGPWRVWDFWSVRGRSDRTPERESAFLAALAAGHSVTRAAQAIKSARRTVYCWRASSERFAKAWGAAIEDGTDLLEDEATRRAVEGVRKPEFFQGDVVGHVQEYSDQLLVTLLKARRRWKYSDRIEQRVTESVRVVEVTSFAGAPED